MHHPQHALQSYHIVFANPATGTVSLSLPIRINRVDIERQQIYSVMIFISYLTYQPTYKNKSHFMRKTPLNIKIVDASAVAVASADVSGGVVVMHSNIHNICVYYTHI